MMSSRKVGEQMKCAGVLVHFAAVGLGFKFESKIRILIHVYSWLNALMQHFSAKSKFEN